MKATSLTTTEMPEGQVAFSLESIPTFPKSSPESRVKVCSDIGVLPFGSRIAAGRLLSRHFLARGNVSELLVLAVSPGATEVARGISESLRAPLDLLFSCDVSLPWQRDIVLATVNSDGGRVVDEAVCRSLRLSRYFVYNCIAKAENNLQRRVQACRSGIASMSRLRKRILLVDDGEAKPAHLAAAIKSLHKQDVAEVLFMAPIASLETVKAVAEEVALCLLLAISDPLRTASAYYASFPEVADDQIREILKPQKTVESIPLRAAVAAGY